MSRHAPAAGAWALVASSALLAAALTGCAKAAGPPSSAPSPGAVPMVTAAPGASLTPARAETIFLEATAAHLCAVQGRVYSDPAQLADAYRTPPPYPELSRSQIDAFSKRITSDAAFAGRLTDAVRKTCGAVTAMPTTSD